MPTRTLHSIKGNRGDLTVSCWENEAPYYVAVLVHGYGEHLGRYQHVADVLHVSGAVVIGPDHQGHGLSQGERVEIADFDSVVEDLGQVIDHYKQRHPDLPVVVIGHSMGGMIAQTLASTYPEVVDSMTSIFSTTGSRKVGQPSYSTLWRIARAKAPNSESDAIINYRAMMTHIGDINAEGAISQWQQYAKLAWHRNGSKSDSKAVFRQIGAIMKSGDRTRLLNKVSAPTLVIHGDVDRMVHPSGGVATANAISGAKHQVLRGLRHQIDTIQSHRIADSILGHIKLHTGHKHGA